MNTIAINTYEDYLYREYSRGAISYKEYYKALYRFYNDVTVCGEIMHLDALGYDTKGYVLEEINRHDQG